MVVADKRVILVTYPLQDLSDLEQASINIPTSGSGFVRRDSEVVIITHPLVPWTAAAAAA